MRTHNRKTGLFLVASIMAVGLLASTAMGQVYTDPVGFVKVDAVKNGLTMMSMPLKAGDDKLYGAAGCVGDMLAENLAGGVGAGAADMIFKWDPGSQEYKKAFLIAGWGAGYDGKWYDETAGAFTDMALDPGDGFWVLRRNTGAALATVTFLGWVPVEPTKSVPLVKGLNMFGWPYPTTLDINASTLGTVGTGGVGSGAADMVFVWDPATQEYKKAFLIAGWGAGYDGKWYDETAGDFSTIQFGPGIGAWYLRRPDLPITWVCEKPYS